MANNYTWDFTKLVTYLLPSFLRKDRLIGWLKALCAPSDTLHTQFITFVSDKIYEQNFTGQVISLERLLNDQFDSSLRRIYITDGNREEIFIFNGDGTGFAEGNESYFFNGTGVDEVYVFNGEDSSLLYDFVVNVPVSLVYDSAKFNALIIKYKLAGKKYIIQTF